MNSQRDRNHGNSPLTVIVIQASGSMSQGLAVSNDLVLELGVIKPLG